MPPTQGCSQVRTPEDTPRQGQVRGEACAQRQAVPGARAPAGGRAGGGSGEAHHLYFSGSLEPSTDPL